MTISRLLIIVISTAALLGVGTANANDFGKFRGQNQIAAFSGNYRIDLSVLPPSPVGELVDCSADPALGLVLETHKSYRAMPGICDDLSDRPCNGRVTARIERCSATALDLNSGDVVGGYAVSQLRICFDPDADPDAGYPARCSAAEAVATGTIRGVGRRQVELNVGYSDQLVLVDEGRWFQIDGRWARVRPGSYSERMTFQRDPDGPANCITAPDGCGVIGSAVRLAPR